MILNISYPTQAPEQPKKGTDPTDLIGNLYYIIYTFYTPTETFKCSFDDIIESDSLTAALKTYLQVTPWVPAHPRALHHLRLLDAAYIPRRVM